MLAGVDDLVERRRKRHEELCDVRMSRGEPVPEDDPVVADYSGSLRSKIQVLQTIDWEVALGVGGRLITLIESPSIIVLEEGTHV